MKKEDIIKRLLELNYPPSEYWLVTGGAMVLYDIKESTNDIDLGCSKFLADTLEDKGYLTALLSDGTRRISVADDVEIFEEWLFDKIEIRCGVPVISLKGLLEMKKGLGREKDIEDIKLIEEVLCGQKKIVQEMYDEKVEIIYNQIDEAISVMREVARWGREKGFRLWLDEWLTPEELLTDEAKPENFCIGEIDGKIACAFILQRRDSTYWKDSSDVQAVYLHKLCVKREYAHRNMTKLVVEAIKDECRKKGIKYIRLDTGLDEKVVRKIYLNAGFKIVDIIDYDNGRSVALYEMEV